MLSAKTSDYFPANIRTRGRSYFLSGRVNILSTGSNSVVAEVIGSDAYIVTLGLTNRSGAATEIQAFCTCPYVDTNLDFCKHIWATLLAVEKRPPFSSLSRNVRLELLNGSTGDDDDDGFAPDAFQVDQLSINKDYGRGLTSTRPQSAPKKLHGGSLPMRIGHKSSPKPKVSRLPTWSQLFQSLAARTHLHPQQPSFVVGPLQPLYVLETRPRERHGVFAISLVEQLPTASGRPGKPKKLSIRAADINRMSDPIDRQICLMLVGAGSPNSSYDYYGSSYAAYQPTQSYWRIADEVRGSLLPLLTQTGRLRFRHPQSDELIPLSWDENPWELFLPIQSGSKVRTYSLTIAMRRGDQRFDILNADWIVDGEPMLFVCDGLLSQATGHGCAHWVDTFRKQSTFPVAESDRKKFFADLSNIEHLPPIEWPHEWNIVEVRDVAPKPELHLTLEKETLSSNRSFATGEVRFRYDDLIVQSGHGGPVVFDTMKHRQIHRCREEEQRLLQRIRELGAERDPYGGQFRLLERNIPAMLGRLLDEGWTVLGNRRLFRSPAQVAINVTTGIDWFELEGTVDFGGQSTPLPELLAAARKGERFVRLGDGSMGILPEQWLAQHRMLLDLGQVDDGKVRYAKTQIGLLDALLARMPDATFDANLAVAREKIRTFNGIQKRSAPPEFVGTLRTYQEQGLAWLYFLNDFGWGGCLADDMGLGKTIQVLALLADRKQQSDSGPSLVIMPKSIVFNWVREATAFAPHLRVLDYTGGARSAARDDLKNFDVVLTTYGTMRRDIEFLSKPQFNYVVLDEAQAIKNPGSQNAKAARLLRARNRLVMTGTPVENQLGDLWSLFEFLNPGMLGTVAAFRGAFAPSRNQDPQQLSMLHHTLRPFILRRTKEQVAPELPKRTEQTIECTMSPRQAAYYNELRNYYRETLLGRVDRVGLAKSKVYVLEALLRLRQAACHPGLIDESKREMESAKMEAVLPMISELIEEGHKALVFSQFTKMLAMIREHLDKKGITYEYLDGKTKKRNQNVDRFQRDAQCPLFLISLKAGGVGLNLTAADYVFLLDPWWNPAVEAQAIDRTHRIGQTKSVIAYRIITRETVEAKIIELQKTKRELADAIITQANSVIQTLSRDDLAMLLS